MKISYLGHSTFLVSVSGQGLLFDPFISPNERAQHVRIEEIRPQVILVSHAHQDHTADVEQIAKASGATVVSNFEIVNAFLERGVANGIPMNHGGTVRFDWGTVKMVNAVHTSSFPEGGYGGNPAGFVVSTEEGTFYYAGDTALTYDMKLIGEAGRIDFAMLPIGDHFTMGIDDALIAADFVNTNRILAMHYDTFPPIEVDRADCEKKARAKGKELVFLEIGEAREF